MRVAFLHHNPGGYVGGAELTMREFANKAPKGVEVIWPTPGDVLPKHDRLVIGNWHSDRPTGFRYVHDMRGDIRDGDTPIFCSPLQRETYGIDGHLIPPALDLNRFRPNRETRRKLKRDGAVAIGAWRNPGKGQHLLREYGPLDLYGEGEFVPHGPNINYCGPLEPGDVPETLWRYSTFVHLPTSLEPFGRAVCEAWAAGCSLVVNNLVGARYWIEQKPDKLESAAEDFWGLVCA